jgi:hypothetical protein
MWEIRRAICLCLLLCAGTALANHPVLVEGNCDSPVFGTTVLSTAGSCGDYDGDGRIGTAEDTDGADRIFGTLQAAIGPGTGAGAGTGANLNGTVLIVASGRFTLPTSLAIPDTAGPTLLAIEAAAGVVALIDAVAQGDTAANNNFRQSIAGFHITASNVEDRIVLRNLTFRNWSEAIRVNGGARVVIENCTFERNLDYAVRVMGSAHVMINGSRVFDTGHRFGTATPLGAGIAISYEGSASGLVSKSAIFNNLGPAVTSSSSGGAGAVRYYQVVIGGNGNGILNATPITF